MTVRATSQSRLRSTGRASTRDRRCTSLEDRVRGSGLIWQDADLRVRGTLSGGSFGPIVLGGSV